MNDTDLHDRFTKAASGLPDAGDGLDQVILRGRRRRHVRYAMATVAVAGLVAGTGLVAGALLDGGPIPMIDDPVVSPTSPGPSPVDAGPADPGSAPVSIAELGWVATVYGPEGAVRYDGTREGTQLTHDPVEVAFGLRDGSLVAQASLGEPIVRLGTGTDEESLGRVPVVEGGQSQRLLGVTEEDGAGVHVWFSVREGEGDGEQEVLWRMALDGSGTGEIRPLAAYSSGADALDVHDGRLAYLLCHLQCQLVVAPVEAVGDADADTEPPPVLGDWFGGLDLSPDGRLLATVRHRYDHDLDRATSGELAVFDTNTWEQIAAVELPGLTGWGHNVAFTPDGTDVVVGSTSGAGWFIRQVLSVEPHARLLVESGLVTFHGPLTRTPDTDPGIALWPEIGADAMAQADAAGTVQREEWRQQPTEVVARFLADEAGWHTPVIGLADQGDGYAVVDVSGDASRFRFQLLQPEGSEGWWIAYAARWNPATGSDTTVGLSVSKADGRLEAHAGSEQAGRLQLRYRDATGVWASTPDSQSSALQADVSTDLPGALLAILRASDDTILDLLLTGIPPGPFAAG